MGVALPINQHRLLRAAARGRQHAAGGHGRASVSKLLSELVERHETELQSYAQKDILSEVETMSA
jgi:hypothetical protein